MSSSSEGFASCPRGSSVVGGGYPIEPQIRASGRLLTVVSSRPTESGWKVECVDAEGKTVTGCRTYVLCASILYFDSLASILWLRFSGACSAREK